MQKFPLCWLSPNDLGSAFVNIKTLSVSTITRLIKGTSMHQSMTHLNFACKSFKGSSLIGI